MHRIYVQFAIYLNGENISNRRFSSASPKSFEQVHCLAEMLFYYLLVLLLNALKPEKNCIRIGNLSVRATCGNLTVEIINVHGVLPVSKQEILDLLEENGALPNLAHFVVNYLLSKNSEERP